MKVKELVIQLSKLDQELDILCLSEDHNISVPFEINGIDTIEIEKCRIEGRPMLKYKKSLTSTKCVIIDISSDI